MRLYHYAPKGNSVLTDGILSFAQNPQADISYYIKRSCMQTHSEIIQWMEKCFIGRSCGIRCFTEPIQWHPQSLSLKTFVESTDLFSFDITALQKDGLLDAIYLSPCILEENIPNSACCDETLKPLHSIQEIDSTPLSWDICNDEKGWRFAFIRYYLIIMKKGIIPINYLKKES